MSESVAIGVKPEVDAIGRRSGAVLDGERERVPVVSSKVQVGVAPRVELGAASKRLAGAQMGCALAGVMGEKNGDVVAALKTAEKVEQRRDVGGDVLVDAMKTDEGIEHEQDGPQRAHGVLEATLIELHVDAQDGSDDDVDVERLERDRGRGGEPPPRRRRGRGAWRGGCA